MSHYILDLLSLLLVLCYLLGFYLCVSSTLHTNLMLCALESFNGGA